MFRSRRTDTIEGEARGDPYYYHPLDASRREIRLIRVVDVMLGGEMHIELVTSSLDSNPAFTLLAYTWDVLSGQSEIVCNGRSILVQRKVEKMLHSVHTRRAEGGPALFFIDALCTNQEDFEEKSHQVQLYPDITHHAALTLCWLDATASQITAGFLARIAPLARHIRPLPRSSLGQHSILQSPSKITVDMLRSFEEQTRAVLDSTTGLSNDFEAISELNGLVNDRLFSR